MRRKATMEDQYVTDEFPTGREHPPDPEMRSPATSRKVNRADHDAELGGSLVASDRYGADLEISTTVRFLSVHVDDLFCGLVVGAGNDFHAISARGVALGSYPTRHEAAAAIGGAA
jgi:hypothetical protein